MSAKRPSFKTGDLRGYHDVVKELELFVEALVEKRKSIVDFFAESRLEVSLVYFLVGSRGGGLGFCWRWSDMYNPDGRNGWRFLVVKGVDGREGCSFLAGRDIDRRERYGFLAERDIDRGDNDRREDNRREGYGFLAERDVDGVSFGARPRFLILHGALQEEGFELFLEFGIIRTRP